MCFWSIHRGEGGSGPPATLQPELCLNSWNNKIILYYSHTSAAAPRIPTTVSPAGWLFIVVAVRLRPHRKTLLEHESFSCSQEVRFETGFQSDKTLKYHRCVLVWTTFRKRWCHSPTSKPTCDLKQDRLYLYCRRQFPKLTFGTWLQKTHRRMNQHSLN